MSRYFALICKSQHFKLPLNVPIESHLYVLCVDRLIVVTVFLIAILVAILKLLFASLALKYRFILFRDRD